MKLILPNNILKTIKELSTGDYYEILKDLNEFGYCDFYSEKEVQATVNKYNSIIDFLISKNIDTSGFYEFQIVSETIGIEKNGGYFLHQIINENYLIGSIQFPIQNNKYLKCYFKLKIPER